MKSVRLLLLSVLFILLLNEPIITLVDHVVLVLGIPVLSLYGMGSWALLIGPLAVASMVKEEPITADEVVQILKSSQTLLATNRQLTRQSTELQPLTRQFSDGNELHKIANHQKDEFLPTVTHEIRTPITSIRALTEILYDEPDLDATKRPRFLITIMRKSERLTLLINQVLELERIESGRAPLQRSMVSLNERAKEAADTCRPLATDKHRLVKTSFPLEPIRVNADRDRLMQVLINLISNAVKFSPDQASTCSAGPIPVRFRSSTGALASIPPITIRFSKSFIRRRPTACASQTMIG